MRLSGRLHGLRSSSPSLPGTAARLTVRRFTKSPRYRLSFQLLLLLLVVVTVYNFASPVTITKPDKSKGFDAHRKGQAHRQVLQGIRDLIFGVPENECIGWHPAGRQDQDPPGCLRARQYRQVEAVLAREEARKQYVFTHLPAYGGTSPHKTLLIEDSEHWRFTEQHNVATLRQLLNCYLPPSHADHIVCAERPLIVSGYWYTATILNGETSGEGIWQRYLVKEIEQLGYYWIAVGPYENWVTVAEMMPDVYAMLWNWPRETISCLTDPRCIAKDHYTSPESSPDLSIGVPDEERGVIPLWALSIVDYWGTRPKELAHNPYWYGTTGEGEWSYQPLGQEWIATPWALPGGHFHLPYSMEEECLQLPTKSHSERDNDVLILTKRSSYFEHGYAPPREYFTRLSQEPDFHLVSAAKVEDGHPLPEGLTSIGVQPYEQYSELVGGMKAMLGIGFPVISPSIYAALCQGVPVVIPYFDKDPKLEGWSVFAGPWQHGPASLIGPPYVYSYYNRNYTMMLDAIRMAIETPIERYIPDDMKSSYALSKMREYLARDLQGMFRARLKDNGGKIPKLTANVRERCIELGHCTPGLPAGRRPYRHGYGKRFDRHA